MKGDFSPVPPSSTGSVDLRVKVPLTTNFPLFVIWKTLEFTFLIVSSVWRFSGSFPINRGPKSNTFSLMIKTF